MSFLLLAPLGLALWFAVLWFVAKAIAGICRAVTEAALADKITAQCAAAEAEGILAHARQTGRGRRW